MFINPEQNDVAEFMSGVGQEVILKPTPPDFKLATLRFNLIYEELLELAEAMGLTIEGKLSVANSNEQNINMIEIIDALCDLNYVVYGAAVSMGVDLQPYWNEVQRSNLSKIRDGYKREDGKWMKGPSYSPPDIASIFNQNEKTNI